MTDRGFVCGFCREEAKRKAILKALSEKVGEPIKGWLKRRYAAGAKLSEIGIALGYTANSSGTMCRLFSRLGLAARPRGGAKPQGVTDKASAAFKRNQVRMKNRNPGSDHDLRVRMTRGMIPHYRKRASQWELLALATLRSAGFKPVHQFQIGPYSADIALPDRKLDIEIDGRNHYQPGRKEREEKRTRYLRNLGWTVVRVGQIRRQKATDGFQRRVLEAVQ